MAEGIVKRHSRKCPFHDGKRCRCDGGWEAWVYLAREKRKVRKTFAREDEAKSWRAEASSAAAKGGLRVVAYDKRTLYEAVTEFVSGMEAGTIRPKGKGAYKPNTVRSYERAVRLHLRDSELGMLRPPDVRRDDVQAFADGLLAKMAPHSASNALNPVQAFFARGLKEGKLGHNPTEDVDLPAGQSKRPRRIVAPAEAARLLAALPAEDRPIWATAFYAGLRRGELQALRCMDVDLGGSLIHVRKGWDQVEGEIEPKSEAGKRTIPLLAVLRDHLDEQLLRTGRSGTDRMFGRSADQAFYASTIDGRAKRAWTAHNLAEREVAEEEGRPADLLTILTMHECRHTFASILIDTGANPKAIQEVMGHSKIQTTFDVYGHLLPGSYDDVRARMDAYLSACEPLPAG
ncbi:MAG: site-specific integrase [Actinobacteria bacterium]|nr:site-specific integrase [Actinomycetota bacterium]